MSRFVIMFCFNLAVIYICEAVLPDGEDCPTESFNAPGVETEIALDSTENSTLECPCVKRLCLSLCCPIGSFLILPGMRKCTPVENRSALAFPPQHDLRTLEIIPEQLRINDFHIFSWDPCQGETTMYKLGPIPMVYWADEYKLLANGSIYFPIYDVTVDFTDFCFGAFEEDNIYSIVLCNPDYANETKSATEKMLITIVLPACAIISIPFFLVTFAVYSVTPTLKNMHGATLRGYVATSIVAYTSIFTEQLIPDHKMSRTTCISLAFVIHFSSLASAFWLNVMCFDIWWTFGGFRSLHGNVRHWEPKKFIIYSVYAWGSASLTTGLCLIMDYVPTVPQSFARPDFGLAGCWFSTTASSFIYYYGPMGVTAVFNIYFFLSTTMKMIQHEKDTAHHLEKMDSQRHDDNKQRFNIYLKLFIVMGTNWSMDVICWFCNDRPKYLWLIAEAFNNLQGVIIFVIFVWKANIKRLLLKHLDCLKRSATAEAVTTLRETTSPDTKRTKEITDEIDAV